MESYQGSFFMYQFIYISHLLSHLLFIRCFYIPSMFSNCCVRFNTQCNFTWFLFQVNVSVEELRCARERHITDLLYPHNTVLDDSIGCALWFAARGAGLCQVRLYVCLYVYVSVCLYVYVSVSASVCHVCLLSL